MPTANSRTFNIIRDLPRVASGAAGSAKSALYNAKELLKDTSIPGAWTVLGSSDGVTAALDGVDRITDYTKWVRGSTASAPRSWIALQSPNGLDAAGTGPVYLVISYNGTSDSRASVLVGAAVPTGGTTLLAPTMTDQMDAPAGSSGAQVPDEDTTALMHMSRATNGEFHLFMGHVWHFMLRKMANTHPDNVTHKLYVGIAYRNTGQVMDFNDTYNFATTNGSYCPGRIRSIGNGTQYAAALSTLGFSNIGVTNLYTGKDTSNVPGGEWVKWPVFVMNATSSNMPLAGSIPDCYYTSNQCPTFSLNNGDGGDATQLCTGSFWVPWDSNLVPTEAP